MDYIVPLVFVSRVKNMIVTCQLQKRKEKIINCEMLTPIDLLFVYNFFTVFKILNSTNSKHNILCFCFVIKRKY